MKNREKFAKEIIDMAIDHDCVAVVNGIPCRCKITNCAECDLDEDMTCHPQYLKEWAEAEYVEYETDWSKVPVDTPILVSMDDKKEYGSAHFAKYESEGVYAWYDGRTSWTENIQTLWGYAELADEEDKKKYRKVKHD